MTNQPAQGITTEQFRIALEQLAIRREAKKQRVQQAADDLALHLARERIMKHQGENNQAHVAALNVIGTALVKCGCKLEEAGKMTFAGTTAEEFLTLATSTRESKKQESKQGESK